MEWLSQNWIPLAVGIAFVFLMRRGGHSLSDFRPAGVADLCGGGDEPFVDLGDHQRVTAAPSEHLAGTGTMKGSDYGMA